MRLASDSGQSLHVTHCHGRVEVARDHKRLILTFDEAVAVADAIVDVVERNT